MEDPLISSAIESIAARRAALEAADIVLALVWPTSSTLASS